MRPANYEELNQQICNLWNDWIEIRFIQHYVDSSEYNNFINNFFYPWADFRGSYLRKNKITRARKFKKFSKDYKKFENELIIFKLSQ